MSFNGREDGPVRAVNYWNWTVTDEVTGKRRVTRFQMAEETAMDWPGAVKVENTLTVRHCPETDAERGLLAPKSYDMPTWGEVAVCCPAGATGAGREP